MAKKRGLVAELHRQSRLAAQRQRQRERDAAKANAAAQRRAAQLQADAARAARAIMKQSAADQKAAAQRAKTAHLDARLAEVDAMNAELQNTYDEIDSMLAATLEVDDYVDLQSLRVSAMHPPFSSEYERPNLPPPMPPNPPEPQFVPPPGEPSKLGGLFGARKKYAEIESAARKDFEAAHRAWRAEMDQMPARRQSLQQQHSEAEAGRLRNLEEAHSQYQNECSARDEEAAIANEELDNLVSGLAYGVDSAIQEYVSIVLSRSVYPDSFPVEHEYDFDASTKELTLTALVPPPECIPTTKEYKYLKAKDEITTSLLPRRDVKERYRTAVAQVAVRSLHEVFEADRAGHMQSVALTVAVDTTDPATGHQRRIPLVVVAAARDEFSNLDLANVVPSATLEHFGGSLSKSPIDLTPVDASKAIRGRPRG